MKQPQLHHQTGHIKTQSTKNTQLTKFVSLLENLPEQVNDLHCVVAAKNAIHAGVLKDKKFIIFLSLQQIYFLRIKVEIPIPIRFE
jgi:hypothetical protein